jgi:hypothetical protein
MNSSNSRNPSTKPPRVSGPVSGSGFVKVSLGVAEGLRRGEVTWATLSNAAHIRTEVAKATMNRVLINDKIGFRRSSYLLKTGFGQAYQAILKAFGSSCAIFVRANGGILISTAP